jgi:hypothetical protein
MSLTQRKKELLRLAKEADPSREEAGNTTPTETSGSGSGTTRNEVVYEFALQVADVVCQRCGEYASFYTKGGEPSGDFS